MNIYSGRCTFSTITVTNNLPTCKAHLAQVTRAFCLQSLVFMKVDLLFHFCDEGHRVFFTGWSHNQLKAIWCIVGQQSFCHKVVSFCFFTFFFWRGKMTNKSSSSLKSFHIYRKLNGRWKCKVLYEEKGAI